MIKNIRRTDRAIVKAQAIEILKEAEFGFLGTVSKEGTPYVIPLNHVYTNGYIVFHCAKEGHKLDNIRLNPHVCYCVCTEHQILPEALSTAYASAVAFGKAEIIEAPDLKKELLECLVNRLAPGSPQSCPEETFEKTCVVRIKVERITGKKNSPLTS